MKWTVVVAVMVVIGVAGGGYYFLQPHSMRVEVHVDQPSSPRGPAEAEQVRRDIGTYRDAKHPGFPEQEKRE